MNTSLVVATNQNGFSAFELMMDDAVMSRFERMADIMSSAKATIPKHLQGNKGDCLAVIMQAAQWQMNPYAVAQKTHQVNGVLGYEAQLVNAVITARAPVKGRIRYEWFGDWSKVNGKDDKSWDKGIKVWAQLIGEDEPRELTITMAQVGSVRNSPLWTNDPRQQIAYLAIKRWSRLHCPDVILGIYSPDEVEERSEFDVTPDLTKKHQGVSGLKAQMAQRENVVDAVVEKLTVDEAIKSINEQVDLNDLANFKKSIASQVGDYSSEEKELLNQAYGSKKHELSFASLISDMESSTSLDALNNIMGERFEPVSSSFSDEEVSKVNNLYDQKEAELSE